MWQSSFQAELLLREKEREIQKMLETKKWLQESKALSPARALPKAVRQKKRLMECNEKVNGADAQAFALAGCGQ